MVRVSADDYSYHVVWSEEEQSYVASCVEFPGPAVLAPDWDAALDGIKKLVNRAISDMEKAGDTIPAPKSVR